MSKADRLVRVAPHQLGGLLDEARAQRWSHLVLVGPDPQLGDRPEAWPESWRTAEQISCGSVVQYRFRVVDYDRRFVPPLMNEAGDRDIWPVLAQTMTTGYGSAGTYGFHRSGVHDRWNNGKTHSAFLTRDFCDKYWVPFLRDGTIIEDDAKAEPPPWWLQIIATVQPRFLIAALILWFVGWCVVRLVPPSWWPLPTGV